MPYSAILQVDETFIPYASVTRVTKRGGEDSNGCVDLPICICIFIKNDDPITLEFYTLYDGETKFEQIMEGWDDWLMTHPKPSPSDSDE